MLFAIAACARPVGDFGRAKPSVIHDEILPYIGKRSAEQRAEPASDYRLTDEEKKLRDVTWRLLTPVHAGDWISETLVEAQRTRVFPPLDHKLRYQDYYYWLRKKRFSSSETRWNRLISDIKADYGAIGPFYEQARIVYAIDERRLNALEKRDNVDEWHQKNTPERVEENRMHMRWVLRAINYRYQAYRYAIDQLSLETPSPLAGAAESELSRFERRVQRGGYDIKSVHEAAFRKKSYVVTGGYDGKKVDDTVKDQK